MTESWRDYVDNEAVKVVMRAAFIDPTGEETEYATPTKLQNSLKNSKHRKIVAKARKLELSKARPGGWRWSRVKKETETKGG